MTAYRSHRDPAAVLYAPVNPYFYVPKYRSSDALPAPEIFIIFLFTIKRKENFVKMRFHNRISYFFPATSKILVNSSEVGFLNFERIFCQLLKSPKKIVKIFA